MARRRLHEALLGRRSTRLEYGHELPQLQDRLLDAQFDLRQARDRVVLRVVSGIPAAGRSEVVNELLGWLDPKLVTVYGFRECNDVERERPPLWRYWRILPPKGGLAPGGRDRFAAPGARGRPPSAAGSVGCAAFRRGQGRAAAGPCSHDRLRASRDTRRSTAPERRRIRPGTGAAAGAARASAGPAHAGRRHRRGARLNGRDP
jgi:hypothetical protein